MDQPWLSVTYFVLPLITLHGERGAEFLSPLLLQDYIPTGKVKYVFRAHMDREVAALSQKMEDLAAKPEESAP